MKEKQRTVKRCTNPQLVFLTADVCPEPSISCETLDDRLDRLENISSAGQERGSGGTGGGATALANQRHPQRGVCFDDDERRTEYVDDRQVKQHKHYFINIAYLVSGESTECFTT